MRLHPINGSTKVSIHFEQGRFGQHRLLRATEVSRSVGENLGDTMGQVARGVPFDQRKCHIERRDAACAETPGF